MRDVQEKGDLDECCIPMCGAGGALDLSAATTWNATNMPLTVSYSMVSIGSICILLGMGHCLYVDYKRSKPGEAIVEVIPAAIAKNSKTGCQEIRNCTDKATKIMTFSEYNKCTSNVSKFKSNCAEVNPTPKPDKMERSALQLI